MKIYRLSFRRPDSEHTGYHFVTTRHEALTIKHQNELKIPECEGHSVEIEVFKIEVTKVGVLAALRKFATHADNG